MGQPFFKGLNKNLHTSNKPTIQHQLQQFMIIDTDIYYTLGTVILGPAIHWVYCYLPMMVN